MKLIIAGGRSYKLTPADFAALDKIPDVTEVVSGGCSGADAGGEEWARSRNIPVRQFKADWNAFGKSAGPRRNAQMAEYADALAMFPGGAGTANMHKLAKAAGLKTFRRDASRSTEDILKSPYLSSVCHILGAEVVAIERP